MAKELTVLVVDDNKVTQQIHSALLRAHNFNVTYADNGQQAVDLFLSGQRFDLVLMDMEMPVKDGRQATRELREMGVDNMIVGVTSCPEIQSFIQAGLTDCYAKPLTIQTVNLLRKKLENNN